MKKEKYERERAEFYYMRLAMQLETRSTCSRESNGAVLVIEKTPIASGYTGGMSKYKHCDKGHDYKKGKCENVVHAELNAMIHAAKLGIRTNGVPNCIH